MAERKKRFSGLYWQQFALTAGMVMLTLLLLGVSFFALSYNYNFTERPGRAAGAGQSHCSGVRGLPEVRRPDGG